MELKPETCVYLGLGMKPEDVSNELYDFIVDSLPERFSVALLKARTSDGLRDACQRIRDWVAERGPELRRQYGISASIREHTAENGALTVPDGYVLVREGELIAKGYMETYKGLKPIWTPGVIRLEGFMVRNWDANWYANPIKKEG